jgi:hypothetical protein
VPCVLLLPVLGAMSSGVVGWLFVARGSRLRAEWHAVAHFLFDDGAIFTRRMSLRKTAACGQLLHLFDPLQRAVMDCAACGHDEGCNLDASFTVRAPQK